MAAVRLEKVREDSVLSDREIIARLMACPYLEEELAGVDERGVRLSVERLAKKSKVPKAILFANAALEKELRKQISLLDSAKHHRTNIISWSQRQFFLRYVFDGQNNFRYATRKLPAFPTLEDGGTNEADLQQTANDSFDCVVSSVAKATKTRFQNAKGRASSVTISGVPNPSERLAFSAPNQSRGSSRRVSAKANTPGTSAHRLRRAVSVHTPDDHVTPWYSCLSTKPWMLDNPRLSGRRRNKSGRSGIGHRPSSTTVTSFTIDARSQEDIPNFNDLTKADILANRAAPCPSMRRWCSPTNRVILSRIMPSLPDRAYRNILDLFGEDIEEQKRMLQEIAKTMANKDALRDRRWRNLETLLKSLQNE